MPESIEGFKPFRLVLEFYDPDDAEHFMQGMLVAKSNNSNETIMEIIDGLNDALVPYRAAKLLRDVSGHAPVAHPGPR